MILEPLLFKTFINDLDDATACIVSKSPDIKQVVADTPDGCIEAFTSWRNVKRGTS